MYKFLTALPVLAATSLVGFGGSAAQAGGRRHVIIAQPAPVVVQRVEVVRPARVGIQIGGVITIGTPDASVVIGGQIYRPAPVIVQQSPVYVRREPAVILPQPVIVSSEPCDDHDWRDRRFDRHEYFEHHERFSHYRDRDDHHFDRDDHGRGGHFDHRR